MNTKFSKEKTPVKLYRNPKSGHCHRVELMLAFLEIPYETVDVDMANGAHKAPDFLKMNPLGQVPAIDDNGILLCDSNAILVYLCTKYATDYAWLPSDPYELAQVQRWLSIAAGEIAYGACAARLVTVFGAELNHETAKAIANSLFKIMDLELSTRDYLAGQSITVADVAGYSYIEHAPEGGVSLEAYPNIRNWLNRIEQQPNFVGMAKTALPAH